MGDLQQFVAELLEEHGAVVEPVDPEGLDVLAPPSVQRALDVPEVARFGFAAELPPDAQRVGLEPDWLDRLGRLLGAACCTDAQDCHRQNHAKSMS